MLKKYIWTVAIALSLLSAGSHAQNITKTGTTAAKFLSLGIGPGRTQWGERTLQSEMIRMRSIGTARIAS